MDGHVEVQALLAQLKLEEKIKEGAENMLHEFNDNKNKTTAQQKKQVIVQLEAASANINLLKQQLKSLGHSEDGSFSPEASPELPTKESSISSRPHAGSTPSLHFNPRRNSNAEVSLPQFTLLFDSLDAKDDAQVSSSKVAAIESLLASYPLLRAEFAISQMLDKLRPFIQSPDSLVLAVGFHICRVLAISRAAVAVMRQNLCLDYFIVRSLSRTDANAEYTERVQVLKFVQTVLGLHAGVHEISQGVVRAIVAVAELTSDRLKDWSTVTLGQVALCDFQKAFDSGAITVLVDTMVDGPRDVATSITYVLCSLLDMPRNRKLLRNGADLNCILSVFTDCIADNQHTEPSTERLHITIEVIGTILSSWAGLECFDLTSLVDCLVIPIRVVQDAILDIFIISLGTTPEKLADDVGESDKHFKNHFTAYLLYELISKGLQDRLYSVRSNMLLHSAIRTKANMLSAFMTRVASLILPQPFLTKSMQLPKPLTRALNNARQLQIPAAGGPVFQMNQALRAPARLQIPSMQYAYEDSKPVHDNHQVMQLGQGSTVWIKMGSQMDEVAFRNLINTTNVLTTKTFSRWNWDALLELIQGPLHNPKRLDEACRSTKFMKRLLSFYRPFKYRFASVKNTPQNRKYIHVGKELIQTLLDTQEGARYLGANKLLRQISECLAQLDPTSGITSTEPLLSSKRIRATLTFGYFEMLGVLTRSTQGLRILSQLKVFNMLYNICDTDRSDVIKHFISSLEYTINGHPRLILAKALVRGQKPVRLYATKFLQTLGNRDRHLWVINLLVTQLYDPDMDVCRIAVTALQELSQDIEYLDHFISLKPSLEHLGPMGDSLYIVFMSRPAGYRYLSGFDFVSQEMDEWVHGYNETYVAEIEDYLGPGNTLTRHPRHFFGELVLTKEGSKLLSGKDYISMFHEFIAKHGGSQNAEILVKLKGYMWALGYIASRPLGASLVYPKMVQTICDIFVQSEVYSVRGTAFYVLGLVASSFEGAEMLNQTGWATTLSPFGAQLGIALVQDLNVVKENMIYKFDDHSNEEFDFGHSPFVATTTSPAPLTVPGNNSQEEKSSDDPSKQILSQICDLSNQILANEASKKLVTLRSQYEEGFCSTELFKSMMELLEKYRYKQLARRFLFEIFDSQNILDKLARRRAHKQTISRPNS